MAAKKQFLSGNQRGGAIIGLLIALSLLALYKLFGKGKPSGTSVTSRIGPVQSWYDPILGAWQKIITRDPGSQKSVEVPAQAKTPNASNVKARAIGPALRIQSANYAPDSTLLYSSGAVWSCPVGAHPEEADDCTVWCVLDRQEAQTGQGDATASTGSPKTLPAPWPRRGLTYDKRNFVVSGQNKWQPLFNRGPSGSMNPRFNA